MQCLAVPFLILCTTVAVASAEVQPIPRAQSDVPAPPPPPPPPVPDPIPSVTPRPNPLPPPTPIAVPGSTPNAPAPATEPEPPETPGWTGVVVVAGLGNLTREVMMEDKRDYVSVGMEVHWERPQGALRPGIMLRPDLMLVSGTEIDLGSNARSRFDLSSLLSAAYGEKAYARVALGPLASYSTAVKGVDRLRLGLVAEGSLGWRRAVAIYGEAKRTWGNGIPDLAVTLGLRFDLALLKKLN